MREKGLTHQPLDPQICSLAVGWCRDGVPGGWLDGVQEGCLDGALGDWLDGVWRDAPSPPSCKGNPGLSV